MDILNSQALQAAGIAIADHLGERGDELADRLFAELDARTGPLITQLSNEISAVLLGEQGITSKLAADANKLLDRLNGTKLTFTVTVEIPPQK